MRVEQVDEWIGAEVVDRDGEGVGKVAEVYFRGDDAVLIAVKSGLLGRKRHLVPLEGATLSRNHVRVAYAADKLAQGHGGDTLSREDLALVSEHYGQAHHAEADELEGSQERAERVRRAEEAELHASELETEASSRALEAEDADARAEAAKREADAAHAARRDVESEAQAAREDARRL